MTDKQTPPDWVLLEAAKRGKRLHLGPDMLRIDYNTDKTYRALCDMIERYEQPPVDRKLLCVREAFREADCLDDEPEWNDTLVAAACLRAIELWEEGFGK